MRKGVFTIRIQDLKTMAVIGAGDMGHGIAQASMMAGYKVYLYDINDAAVQRGVDKIYKSLDKLLARGKVTAEQVDAIRNGLLVPTTDLKEAAGNAQFIIEAVLELLPLKQKIFAELDQYAPKDTILATNSSKLSITEIAKATNRPDRVCGVHFFNPAVIMKLVEVVCHDKVAPETIEFSKAYAQALGKVAIVALKDSYGYIVNRITTPVNRLAIYKYEYDGVDYQDIDGTVLADGDPMGIFELHDFTGLDLGMLNPDGTIREDLPKFGPTAYGKRHLELLREGKYGKKTGEGFYKWDGNKCLSSREEIISHRTGKCDAIDFHIVRANEACKAYDEGVCSLEDADRGIVYGRNQKPPITTIKDLPVDYVVAKLYYWAARYSDPNLLPAASIKNGHFKEIGEL